MHSRPTCFAASQHVKFIFNIEERWTLKNYTVLMKDDFFLIKAVLKHSLKNIKLGKKIFVCLSVCSMFKK